MTSTLRSRRWLIAEALRSCALAASSPFSQEAARAESGARERTVVFGSSTALGVGASTEALSWVQKLRPRIAANIDVVNLSVPGIGIVNIVEGFKALVELTSPTLVVVGNSLLNDGIVLFDTEVIEREYLRQISVLSQVALSMGTAIQVTGPYPCALYNDRVTQSVERIYVELASQSLLLCDFYSSVASPIRSFDWFPGLSEDGIHPNDLGHRHLASSVCSTAFSIQKGVLRRSMGDTSWRLERQAWLPVSRVNPGEGLFEIKPRSLMSFSFVISIAVFRYGNGVIGISDHSTAGFGIALDGADVVLLRVDSLDVIGRVTMPVGRWAEVTVVRDVMSGTITIALDDNAPSTFRQPEATFQDQEDIRVLPGGVDRSSGWEVAIGSVALYRTPFRPDLGLALSATARKQESLEIYIRPSEDGRRSVVTRGFGDADVVFSETYPFRIVRGRNSENEDPRDGRG